METPNPVLPENYRRLLEIQMNESMRLSFIYQLIQYVVYFAVVAFILNILPKSIRKTLWMIYFVIAFFFFSYHIFDYMLRDGHQFNKYFVNQPNVDNLI